MTEPAWGSRELTDPHAVADKARRVEAMFAAIAPSYDLNNRVHSLWRDQAWRRAAVRFAQVEPGDIALDAACGTGDLSLALAQSPAAQVIGVDFTVDMLRLARRKPVPRGKAVTFIAGDAMSLPLPDQCIDVVTIAFGIRNVARPQDAIDQFHRVLRPGGRLVILEFSLPANPVLRWLYLMYFNHVLPRTASWIARDRSGAYLYLPRSVNTFLDRSALVDMIRSAGFRDAAVRPLTLGIAVLYRGIK